MKKLSSTGQCATPPRRLASALGTKTQARAPPTRGATKMRSSGGCTATDKVFFSLLLFTNSAPRLDVLNQASESDWLTWQTTNSCDVTTETFKGFFFLMLKESD